MSWRKFFGATQRKDLLAVILGLIVLLVIMHMLGGCGAPRVAPVGTISPGPEGTYILNAALPQPAPEDYEPGAGFGWLEMIAQILPSPWREIVGMLLALLVGRRAGAAPLMTALRQTVAGVEMAKAANPDFKPALHSSLNETQDERTKKLIWDLRP